MRVSCICLGKMQPRKNLEDGAWIKYPVMDECVCKESITLQAVSYGDIPCYYNMCGHNEVIGLVERVLFERPYTITASRTNYIRARMLELFREGAYPRNVQPILHLDFIMSHVGMKRRRYLQAFDYLQAFPLWSSFWFSFTVEAFVKREAFIAAEKDEYPADRKSVV